MAGLTYTEVVSPATSTTWGPGDVTTRPTSTIGSDERQTVVSFNQLCYALQNLLAIEAGADGPVTTGALSRGTTVTLATAAQVISINAVKVALAAQTAQAFGALGTIPEATWGLIAVERVAAGTTTFVSAADNYTTGYATAELAIADLPAITADRVRIGYLTILAGTGGWVAGTDALAGGTGGTPATTTNYYNMVGAAAAPTLAPVYQVANATGDPITSTVG
jgi:hypothetical protein